MNSELKTILTDKASAMVEWAVERNMEAFLDTLEVQSQYEGDKAKTMLMNCQLRVTRDSERVYRLRVEKVAWNATQKYSDVEFNDEEINTDQLTLPLDGPETDVPDNWQRLMNYCTAEGIRIIVPRDDRTSWLRYQWGSWEQGPAIAQAEERASSGKYIEMIQNPVGPGLCLCGQSQANLKMTKLSTWLIESTYAYLPWMTPTEEAAQ